MKKVIFILSISLLGAFCSSQVMGQTSTQNLTLGMPEVLLVAASATPINLILTTTTAGNAVQSSVSDNTARLKISSVIMQGKTRVLTASVDAVPAGTTLKLAAEAPNANFKGTQGSFSTAAVLPTTGSANIITAIGSCYSGTVADDGYVLNYTWGLNDPATNYGLVRATGAGTTTAVVTLTLSAGQ